MNKNNIKLEWNDFHYKVNGIITKNILKKASLNLFNNKFKTLNNEHFLLIQFKIITNTFLCRSISYVQTIQIKDYDLILEIFNESWNLKSEDYYDLTIYEILFTYKILPKDSIINENKILSIEKNNYKSDSFIFGGYNLPKTMDITLWGKCIFFDEYKNAIIKKKGSDLIYLVVIFDSYQEVEVKIKDKIILKFRDELLDVNDLSSFKRVMKNQEYNFEFGELKLKKIKKEVKFLKPIKKNIFLKKNFITMDLETFTVDNIMVPYCISLYDGQIKKSFYLIDFKDSDEMLKESILYIMKRKYHNYKVYFHNFSHFDGIFLLTILSELSNNIIPIIRDGRIIDIKFRFGQYTLYFRDSYLILPSSLKELAKYFKVEHKGIFPYKFINKKGKLGLNYEGDIPNYNYFDKITEFEYLNYCKNFNNKKWDFRNESIKYCEQDCISLYQIINEFSKTIFNLFRLDIYKYPTISSVAFGIFRSKFLKEHYNIPLIYGEMYNFIKSGYTGGSVDVFKPYGENIYHYDVNSLYPFVMKENLMPVGKPIYFEGDIFQYNKEAYGFFEVEVISPENLNYPILQTRIKINSTNKTISPIGNWKGVYFSEEIKNAIKYGYKFKILRGYLFEKLDIFSEYVDFLYKIKQNSLKDSPIYIISKLLLNSLYGRLGMDPKMENHKIVDSVESLKLQKNYNVTNVVTFKNGKELISFFDVKVNNENYSKINISIPISTAVTSYARIHMANLKNELLELGNIIYYTDTDSLDIDNPIDNKYIGSELGKLKFEYKFNEAVFLAPKVYGGVIKKFCLSYKEHLKVKGLKNPINYIDLYSLLIKNNQLKIAQDKWYRDIKKGNILIKNEIYTLMITDNKRQIIYDNNKFINTKPYKLINGEIKN
jgi:hypothetical protein